MNASSAGGTGYAGPSSFDGDGVYVPGGSCAWGSSTVAWTNKNINLIGNNPSITHSSNAFFVGISNSGPTAAAFRISGFNFPSQGSGSPLLTMSGNTQSSGTVPTTGTAWAGFFRIDHLTYNYTGSGGFVFVLNGPLFGLFDHLTGNAQNKSHFEFDSYLDAEYNAVHTLPTPVLTQFLGEYTGRILSAAPGSSSPGGLGSQYMVYIEDSSFACPANYSGAISDSASGGQRMVFRHNTATSACYHYAHWTRSDEWDGDLYEIYNNSYDGGGGSALYPIRMESGTGVIFNNTFAGYSDTTVHLDDRRAGGGEASPHAYSCDGNTSSPAGRPIIDGNAGDASAPGWPCAGQIGNACLNGGCVRGSGASGMGSLPLILWNNGALGVSVDSSNLNYIKTTAHSSTNLNGAKDYCLAATTMPSTCGIYTNSYTPYPYPYPTIGNSVATPTFSPVAGAYGAAQTVTLSSATSGATICYTTDGSTPTSNGAGVCVHGSIYSVPFSVSTTTTIKALGSKSGSTDSTVASGLFTINGSAAAPTFAPGAGSYGGTQSVTISSATSGATICYTSDGSTPTADGNGTCTHGTTYSTTISVSTSQTLKVIASKATFLDSSVSSAAYVINGTASTPTFSPVAGAYGPTQNVTISSSTSGATICYTTNGTSPTSSSPGVCAAGSTQYVAPVSVASSLTIKAIATKAGFTDSSIGSAAYTINGAVSTPTFSPVGGGYGATQTVTISSATGSAVLCYTTDGSTPTANGGGTCTHGTTYSAPITVSSSQTVNAIGTKAGFSDSVVGTATYTINGALPTPTFSPVAGGYPSAQTVTISAISGAPVVIVDAMTETSNANDSQGNTPHRNVYTNCIETCSGGSPGPSPFGTLWCSASAKSTWSASCPSFASAGVVPVSLSGTGLGSLENGNGAGGSDSASQITDTNGGTQDNACAVGSTINSAIVSGLVAPGAISGAKSVFGISTGSPGDSSILGVYKINFNGDAGNYIERFDCGTPNVTNVGGEHYEWDTNYNTSTGSYMGFGMDYDFPNQKIRACFQGCSGWTNTELCPTAGGACITTYPWTSGSLYSERQDYWDPGCTSSSSTNCAHYGKICLQHWSAGTPTDSLTCYNIQSAATHAPISAKPINKTSWTHPQYGIQHQWDINQSSKTLTATVSFSTAVSYYFTSGTATICYTIDGSTPTGNGAGVCTHGTTYTGAITVSSTTTVKAIATQSGFTDSSVGSATYTINGTVANPTFSPVGGTYTGTQSVTLASATGGATICWTSDGSTPTTDGNGTCTHGTTYSGAISVSVSGTILKAIGTEAAFSDSSVVSATYIIAPTIAAPTISGTVKLSGSIQIQ